MMNNKINRIIVALVIFFTAALSGCSMESQFTNSIPPSGMDGNMHLDAGVGPPMIDAGNSDIALSGCRFNFWEVPAEPTHVVPVAIGVIPPTNFSCVGQRYTAYVTVAVVVYPEIDPGINYLWGQPYPTMGTRYITNATPDYTSTPTVTRNEESAGGGNPVVRYTYEYQATWSLLSSNFLLFPRYIGGCTWYGGAGCPIIPTGTTMETSMSVHINAPTGETVGYGVTTHHIIF